MGFMAKMCQADKFVLLDTVQFRKNYFQNRNRIRYHDTDKWVTIPLKKFTHDTLIKDIRIDTSSPLQKKNWELITHSYRNAPCYNDFADEIRDIYLGPFELLSELNIALIKYFVNLLKIDVEIFIASDLKLPHVVGGTEVNFNICKALRADLYLSGNFGRDYLDESRFKENGITVMYQHFKHPVYKQLYGPFMDSLSIIDALFNCGPEETLRLLMSSFQ
jgi:hypothetical protein